MVATKQQANDYAVAVDLNDKILKIVLIARFINRDRSLPVDILNRPYILLAAELQKIYDRNPELSSIEPKPIWQQFDILINSLEEISKSLSDSKNDTVTTHNARVERLHILSGEAKPEFSTEQKKLIEDYEKALFDFGKKVDEISEENKLKIVGWQIPEYNLKYKLDGTIVINQVLKLKSVHAGSITDRLLEQSLKNPNKKFKPDLGKTSRNISTIISSAGFTPILRELFFPAVGDDFIVFRPSVTRDQADRENINTEELDLHLREIGAWCVVIREP